MHGFCHKCTGFVCRRDVLQLALAAEGCLIGPWICPFSEGHEEWDTCCYCAIPPYRGSLMNLGVRLLFYNITFPPGEGLFCLTLGSISKRLMEIIPVGVVGKVHSIPVIYLMLGNKSRQPLG